MIEYPRPPAPLPAKPYPADRIFAIGVAVLLVGSKIVWFATVIGRPDFVGSLRTWRWQYAATIVGYVLYIGTLWGVSRSRHWAFVAAACFAALAAFGGARLGYVGSEICASVVFLYALARLLKVIGPRPSRREGVQVE